MWRKKREIKLLGGERRTLVWLFAVAVAVELILGLIISVMVVLVSVAMIVVAVAPMTFQDPPEIPKEPPRAPNP